jgi:23S rRNA (adenine2503-C2)-methyltransferase
MDSLFTKEPLCFEDIDQNVWKYVFHFQGAVTEAVLYRYNTFEDRTVLCVSVQSGCPVGCSFCGTGKRFIRNLTSEEIVLQVKYILKDKNIEDINSRSAKFQIMFMSMGEPFLNYEQVHAAIISLNIFYQNAQLLVSTIGPHKENELKDFITLSKRIKNVGLQFSIHAASDLERNLIIPYKNKLDLNELRDYGVEWWHQTGRKVYLNYCVDNTNSGPTSASSLRRLFPPNVFCFTFSVICSKDETMKNAGYRNIERIREFENRFISAGYDTRIFDPAGQDTIGGGCGQLFYVQEWMKNGK